MGIPSVYTVGRLALDAALPHCAVPQDECCAAAEESGETKVRQAAEEGPGYPLPYTKPIPGFYNRGDYYANMYRFFRRGSPIIYKSTVESLEEGLWFSYVVLPPPTYLFHFGAQSGMAI